MSWLTFFFSQKKMTECRGDAHLQEGLRDNFCRSVLTLSHLAVGLRRWLLSLTMLNESKRKMVVFSGGVMIMKVADFDSLGCVWGWKPCVKMMFSVEASVKIFLLSNIPAYICTKPHLKEFRWNISESWLLCFVVDQLVCCVLLCRLSVVDLHRVCNVSSAQLRPSGQVSMTWRAAKLRGIT